MVPWAVALCNPTGSLGCVPTSGAVPVVTGPNTLKVLEALSATYTQSFIGLNATPRALPMRSWPKGLPGTSLTGQWTDSQGLYSEKFVELMAKICPSSFDCST